MPLRPVTQSFVTGDIVPSAWANDLGWNVAVALDSRTGYDPLANNLFLVSQDIATGLGIWRLLQAGDYQPGTIPDSAMNIQKVDRHNLAYVSFAATGAAGSGFFDINPAADAPNPSQQYLLIQARHYNYAVDCRVQIAANVVNANDTWIRSIINGSPTTWQRLWHGGNTAAFFVSKTGDSMTGGLTVTGGISIVSGGLNVVGPGSFNSGLTVVGSQLTAGGGINVNGGNLTVGPGILLAAGGSFSGDATIYRSGSPGTGYLLLGNGGQYLGYDGSVFRFTAPIGGAGGGQLSIIGGIVSGGALTVNSGALTVNNGLLVQAGHQSMGSGQQIFWPQQDGRKLSFTSSGDYAIDIGGGVLQLNTSRYVGVHNNAAGAGDFSVLHDSATHTHTFQGEIRVPTLTVNGVTASATPGAGRIPMADGAGKLDGWITGGGGGGGSIGAHTHGGDALIPASVTATGQLVSNAAGVPPLVVASGVQVANLNASQLGGHPASYFEGLAAAGVPSGVITAYDGVSAPGGWTFYTALNDRIPVGAGSTFTVNTDVGSSWTHRHTGNTFGGSATGGSGDNTAGSATSNGVVSGPGSASAVGHSHSLSGVSFSASVGGDTTDTTWQPPMHVVNWIRKN